eukprot:GHVS01023450.1.p1 GENE.GHVS01023450.1~~GHVS01023450.1.p1  ORF type:complete len:234 (+),score=12.34 GHVS01023450.1:27-728(+)
MYNSCSCNKIPPSNLLMLLLFSLTKNSSPPNYYIFILTTIIIMYFHHTTLLLSAFVIQTPTAHITSHSHYYHIRSSSSHTSSSTKLCARNRRKKHVHENDPNKEFEFTIANGYFDWPKMWKPTPLSLQHQAGTTINSSIVVRNERRRVMVEEYKTIRLRYKRRMANSKDRNEYTYWQMMLSDLPRDSCPSRFRERCLATGRGRGVHPFFGLCRHEIRRRAHIGELPGVQKAIW